MDNEKDNSAPNFRKVKSLAVQSCWYCVFFVYVTGFCVKYKQKVRRSCTHVCDSFKEV